MRHFYTALRGLTRTGTGGSAFTLRVLRDEGPGVARWPRPGAVPGERSTPWHTLGEMTSARDDHRTRGDESVQVTFYEAVGGEEFFTRLVGRFYEGVAEDEELRAMYPEEDLGPAEDRLRLFLMQYWGGPRTYNEQRGHPRLRMRHVPFRIGLRERDLWLKHMRAAVDSVEIPEPLERQLWEYMVMAAHSMVNVPEEAVAPQVSNPTAMAVSSEENDDEGGEAVTISLK